MTDATGQKILNTLETVAIGSGNIVDNLTTQDATKALSANMGAQIGSSISDILNGTASFQGLSFRNGTDVWTVSLVGGEGSKNLKFVHSVSQ